MVKLAFDHSGKMIASHTRGLHALNDEGRSYRQTRQALESYTSESGKQKTRAVHFESAYGLPVDLDGRVIIGRNYGHVYVLAFQP